MEDFALKLHANGFKATPRRQALLQLLYKTHKPLTVEGIAKRLDESINVVTLYRALGSLADAGLLLRGSDGRAAHFSYPRGLHHHHLMCIECGFIKSCTTC